MVDDEEEEGDESSVDYISEEECKASGQHNKSCDRDGYCNSCGHGHDDEDDSHYFRTRDEMNAFAKVHGFRLVSGEAMKKLRADYDKVDGK